MQYVKIILLGDHDPLFEPHRHTSAALVHAAAQVGVAPSIKWVPTTEITDALVAASDGLWIAPGSPYRDMERVLWAIRTARRYGIPCLGTGGGFQHMALEYARNVLSMEDADHGEYDPHASRLLVSKLANAFRGKTETVTLTPDSRIANLYGAAAAREKCYCKFGLNPEYLPIFRDAPFRPVGFEAGGEIRAMELSLHRFYIGTLFTPQASSTPENPHPLVTGFVQAAQGKPLTRRATSPLLV